MFLCCVISYFSYYLLSKIDVQIGERSLFKCACVRECWQSYHIMDLSCMQALHSSFSTLRKRGRIDALYGEAIPVMRLNSAPPQGNCFRNLKSGSRRVEERVQACQRLGSLGQHNVARRQQGEAKPTEKLQDVRKRQECAQDACVHRPESIDILFFLRALFFLRNYELGPHEPLD